MGQNFVRCDCGRGVVIPIGEYTYTEYIRRQRKGDGRLHDFGPYDYRPYPGPAPVPVGSTVMRRLVTTMSSPWENV